MQVTACTLYSSMNPVGISVILILTYSDLYIGVARLFFHIKAGKISTMAGNDTLYNDLGNSEGIYGGCHVPWINDSVATHGDSSPVGVVFMGAYLAN